MEGKAKEAFKKFCYENDYSLFAESEKYKDLAIMNNALIIEWLDSVGIIVYVTPYYNHDLGMFNKWAGYESEKGLITDQYVSRQEATEAAIKKAVEIFNEKYKENE
ncbi:hypothetical protein CMU87_17110 [Elizabethkingia anophelis]|nr:hypothetical protein [Elizabethkingia anophelis]